MQNVYKVQLYYCNLVKNKVEANGYIKSYVGSVKNEIVNKYAKEIGDKIGYKLTVAHMITFHGVLGACLNDEVLVRAGSYIDLRIHPFIIRESGAGKALTYGLAEDLANKINLEWATRNRITEAGLIGTVRTRKGVKIEYRGDANDLDIIGFTEAGLLLQNPVLCRHINTIMDTKGWVSRKMAAGVVGYKTHTTLLLTSFKCKLVYNSLQTGFLQRCLMFYEGTTTPETGKVIEWLGERYGVDKRPKVEKQLDVIAKRLIKVRKNNYKFTVDKQAKRLFVGLGKTFVDMIKPYPEFQEEIMRTFGTRWSEHCAKLSAHHCALELRNEINKTDVEYGIHLGTVSLQSAIDFVAENYAIDKTHRRLVKQLDKAKLKGKKTITFSELARNLKPLTVLQIEKMLEVHQLRNELIIDHKKRLITFA